MYINRDERKSTVSSLIVWESGAGQGRALFAHIPLPAAGPSWAARATGAFDILRTMGTNIRSLRLLSWGRARCGAAASIGLLGSLLAACSPSTMSTDGTPPDLAGVPVDMTAVCTDVVGNQLGNPGFEASITGTASNIGGSASSIPNWQGCCGTMQTTTYEVNSMQRYCGERSVRVNSSSTASQNVLHQALNLAASANKTFILSGWVNVTGPSGGEISLDLFDVSKTAIVAPTVSLKNGTNGWFELRATGTMPAGGNVQVRISSSGTIEAYVDQLSLRIP